jgi:hypothetical protein
MKRLTTRTSHGGQVIGASVEISGVDNYGLHEFIRIVNRGAEAQPLAGWVLASVRGNQFYAFPATTLEPQTAVTVHSGPHARNDPPRHLFWTNAQVWNNDSDLAVLFDAGGTEVARFAYPNEYALGRLAAHRKRLRREDAAWRIMDVAGP